MPAGIVFSTARVARRHFDDDKLEGMDDPIEVEIVQHESTLNTPKSEHKVLLKFYGGGHVTGAPSHVRSHNIYIAELTKGVCVAPTYRLAPAEPFPCAIHDAVSTYIWLVKEMGYKPEQIVISGNSAGSNLAEGLAVHLIENDMPLPAGVALWTPWLDLTGSTPALRTKVECILSGNPPNTVSGEEPFRHSPYAPKLEDITKPQVSPLFGDPKEYKAKGHPPLWIEMGNIDRLRDEGLLYFVRLATAGIPVRADLYAEATHFFAGEMSYVESAKFAHQRLAKFMEDVIDKKPVKTELSWIDNDCKVTDLGGVDGAVKLLQESFDEYLGHVKDKERIKKGWSRFGFLDIWNSAVPGTF